VVITVIFIRYLFQEEIIAQSVEILCKDTFITQSGSPSQVKDFTNTGIDVLTVVCTIIHLLHTLKERKMNSFGKVLIEIAGEIGAGTTFTVAVRAIAATVVLEITESEVPETYDKVNRLVAKAMMWFAASFILLNQSRF
jgi:hypothetical protein